MKRKKLVIVESNASFLNMVPVAYESGYDVYFLYSEANSHWYGNDPQGLLNQSTKIRLTDTADYRELVEVIKEISPVATVLAPLEHCVEAVAQACDHLKISFTPLDAIRESQDKFLARMRIGDLDSTKTFLIRDESDLVNAATAVSMPAFLKPRKGTSSIGARKIPDRTALLTAWREVSREVKHKYFSSDFVLETYLAGRMISVEVASNRYGITFLMVDERFRSESREQIEIGTCMPAKLSSDQVRKIEAFIREVIGRLGLTVGVFHIEIILVGDTPHLIEVNPRLMGGSLPLLYNFATGDNIFERVLQTYSGIELKFPSGASGVSMSRIFGAATDGVLNSKWEVERLNHFGQHDKLKVNFWKRPGDSVRSLNSNQDYIGFFFVKSESIESAHADCEKTLRELEEILGIKLLR